MNRFPASRADATNATQSLQADGEAMTGTRGLEQRRSPLQRWFGGEA